MKSISRENRTRQHRHRSNVQGHARKNLEITPWPNHLILGLAAQRETRLQNIRERVAPLRRIQKSNSFLTRERERALKHARTQRGGQEQFDMTPAACADDVPCDNLDKLGDVRTTKWSTCGCQATIPIAYSINDAADCEYT
jgi:acetaldehyde dehydrogenase (acetylating)